MIKLNIPTITSIEAFDACLSGIVSTDMKQNYMDTQHDILSAYDVYEAKANQLKLYEIPFIKQLKNEDIVVGDLSKGDFKHLYNYYMVKRPVGRKIYDKLMIESGGRCPYCGISETYNLDHYLPKSKYPIYSVLPINLIPSCRDCNTGKLAGHSRKAKKQTLHPYFEDECFYLDNWIDADITGYKPLTLSFFVRVPDEWSDINKARAKQHFKDFNLNTKYSLRASDELTTVWDQRNNFFDGLPDDFKKQLQSNIVESLSVNHWKIVVYKTLVEDDLLYDRLRC